MCISSLIKKLVQSSFLFLIVFQYGKLEILATTPSPQPLTFKTILLNYYSSETYFNPITDEKTNILDFGMLLVPIPSPSPSPSPSPTARPSVSPSVSPSARPTPSSSPRSSPRTSPISSPQAKPNILFIVADDQPLESLSRMPFLRSRTNWFNFNKAYVNVSVCCPSRATMLSGKYSHHTGVESNGVGILLDTNKTLPVWLNNAGYRTGLIGKYLNYYPFGGANFVPPGWDHWVVFTPEEDVSKFYYNYSLYENGQLRNYGSSSADYSTDVLKQKALNFINVNSSDPFFLMWTPHTPHEPFTPAPRHESANVGNVTDPPNFNEDDVSDKPQWIKDLGKRPAAEMRANKLAQYRMLLSVDEAIQEFIQALTSSGKINNTIIIYVSDNGYTHGEHRWFRKNCVYEECTHVPLLIYHPNFPGRVINNLVGNMDITATIVEMAGAQANAMDGISMMPLIRNTGNFARTSVLLRMRGDTNPTPGQLQREYWGLRKGKWKYAEFVNTGEKELYDLETDPYELNNLAANPDYGSIVAQLHNEVNQLNN